MTPRRIVPVLALLGLACLRSATAQSTGENVYVVSHIDVTPDHSAETAKLLKGFAADSLKDSGVVRFEVMVQDGRTNHFTVVEVWRNRQAFEAHSALDHTKKFREQMHSYLGSPYDERLHTLVL
jgi:quinol monooxygenase YgiN